MTACTGTQDEKDARDFIVSDCRYSDHQHGKHKADNRHRGCNVGSALHTDHKIADDAGDAVTEQKRPNEQAADPDQGLSRRADVGLGGELGGDQKQCDEKPRHHGTAPKLGG